MVHALQRLQSMQPGELPKPMAAFGVSGGIGGLFSSHPPLEDRIRALQTGTH
jgi:heat shock protein HtpX